MRVMRRPLGLTLVLVLGAFLAACETQLAPPYDETLVEELTAADEKTLVLFSAVSDGSEASAFPQFAPRYEELIGKFGALGHRAEARPVPPLAQKLADQLAKYKVLREVCGGDQGDPGSCVNSSPSAINTIVENLSKMRQTHKATGLQEDAVALFENAYKISIQQALTVETALKRSQ